MILATFLGEVNEIAKLVFRVASADSLGDKGKSSRRIAKALVLLGFPDAANNRSGRNVVAADFEKSGPWIGVGGMAVAFFLYGYSAVALPGLVTSVVLPALWLVLLVLTCVWFTRHPYRAMAMPFLAVATWFVVLLA
jgi:hypothetical protein